MNKHVFDELPAYALGILDADEAALVEQHLKTCENCTTELAAYLDVTDDLLLAVPEVEPAADLHDRLMASIALDSAETPAANLPITRSAASNNQSLSLIDRIRRYFAGGVGSPQLRMAGAFAMVMLLAGNLLLFQRLNNQIALNTTDPALMRAERLTGTGVFEGANGFLLSSADGLAGAIIVDLMPQLEEGQIYQMWLVKDGVIASAARIQVDETTYGGGRVWPEESLFTYDSAFVTIEEGEEGAEQPTGEPVLEIDLIAAFAD